MKKITLTSILICISFCSTLAAQLAGGGYHSLALKEDGAVWAWGYNYHGQLGDGTTEDRRTPVQVSGLTDVISISAGMWHSLAAKRNGTVWGWGRNYYGELGDGTNEKRYTPVQVVGLSGVIAIAGGNYHSLAVKNDGTVWAWGWNAAGQLGDGTTTYRTTPVQVVGLSGVIAVAGGDVHSLALKNDGTVWAWGYNTYGQLGDGRGRPDPPPLPDTNIYYSSVPVQTIGLSNIIAISAGDVHSLALKNDGAVWAWGYNYHGQLGDGNGYPSPTNSLIPVQSLVSGVIAIGSGYGYSLALASYGTVWFYGLIIFDYSSDSVFSIIPMPVDGISGTQAIGGGYDHALALKNDGTVWAWGYNYHGQLGDGTTHNRLYPVQVKGFSTGGSASSPASVLAADFDADGRADPTAVTSDGEWFFWHSSSSYSREGPIELGLSAVADMSSIASASGDVDGDGRGDMALVSAGGDWYFWLSSHEYSMSGPQSCGVSGSPVLGDFDGDNKADPVIVSASGTWYFWLSGRRYSRVSAPFAIPGGTPLAGDFDGDGRADPVMVSATGGWYFWLSKSWYIRNGPHNFGLTGPGFAGGSAAASKPAAGDFDGDGRADPALMSASGGWYFWLSSSFYFRDGPYYLVLP